jgi:hypothetical protein
MIRVQCPECQRSVSDQAATCPQCGRPLRPPSGPRKSQRLRNIGPVLSCAAAGAFVWWWISGSDIGSPVKVRQDAIVTAGGNASLADDPAALDRFLFAQRAGGSFTSAEAMFKYGVLPVSPGTRVHVLQLGFAGSVRAARIEVPAETATQLALLHATVGQGSLSTTGLLTALLSPQQGWTAAQWLQPAPPVTPAP